MKNNIAETLKSIRKAKQIKMCSVVDELKKYNISISATTLYGYENGHSQPNADMFVLLCKIYGIKNLELFFCNTVYDSIGEDIEDYRTLNDSGKKKVKDYISDLLANKQYKKNKMDYTEEFGRYVDTYIKRVDEDK